MVKINSIKVKLLFFQAIVLLILLVTIIVIGKYTTEQKLIILQTNHLNTILETIDSTINEKLDNISFRFKQIANSKDYEKYSQSFSDGLLLNLLDKEKYFLPILSYIHKDGSEEMRVLNGEFSEDLKDFKDEKLYKQVLKNPNKVITSKIKYNQDLKTYVVEIIYLKQGYFEDEFQGILYGAIPISDILGKSYSLDENLIVRIIDKNNNIKFSNIKENGKIIFDQKDMLFNKIKSYHKKIHKLNIMNTDTYSMGIKLFDNKSILLVSYEKDVFLKMESDTEKIMIPILLILFLLILFLVYILSTRFTKPIIELTHAVQDVENKKYDIHIDIKTNDEIEILANSFNDMTKEVKYSINKMQEALKAKSEFLANMSHEIRTPLNAIVGFIDILRENETDKEKLNQLSIIDKSSRSLVTIINEILDFSKLQSGKTEVEKIDFDTFEEFEAIGGLFKGKCSEKNILLNINIAENTPRYLNSDIQKIIQVIANLISNAIKFSPNGTKIELKIYYNFDTKRLFVSVIDEGIGIPKDKQADIFNAFSQADNSTTRKYGGTGLGLSISSFFIKLLGGALELESVENKGSRFHFSIPVEIGKPIEKTVSNDTNKNIENKKILLVEDNKANQMFMKVILKKLNLNFDIANDGVEAVEMFKSNSYDAILMDENMPNMNGIKATKKILEIEEQNNLKHTPIIALTANALKGDRERFMAAGMDEYLTKPLNKKKLSEILRKFL